MKFKVGDRVKVRRDLVVGNSYGSVTYFDFLDDIVRANDYVLTIKKVYDRENNKAYDVSESGCIFAEEMFDDVVHETSDKEKFVAWMTKLAEITTSNSDVKSSITYSALARVICAYRRDDHTYNDGITLEKDIDTLWDYINDPRYDVKQMTLSEIEAELGFKVKIKE